MFTCCAHEYLLHDWAVEHVQRAGGLSDADQQSEIPAPRSVHGRQRAAVADVLGQALHGLGVPPSVQSFTGST